MGNRAHAAGRPAARRALGRRPAAAGTGTATAGRRRVHNIGKYPQIENDFKLRKIEYTSGSSIDVCVGCIYFLDHKAANLFAHKTAKVILRHSMSGWRNALSRNTQSFARLHVRSHTQTKLSPFPGPSYTTPNLRRAIQAIGLLSDMKVCGRGEEAFSGQSWSQPWGHH